MTANEQEDLEEADDTFLKFKENVTKGVLDMADEVQDLETQDVVLKAVSEMTTGGTEFDDVTKVDIATKVAKMVKQQIGSATVAKSRRKRRSNPDESLMAGKSPEEVF